MVSTLTVIAWQGHLGVNVLAPWLLTTRVCAQSAHWQHMANALRVAAWQGQHDMG